MHYEDIKNKELCIVVYKHGTPFKIRYKKNGLLMKQSVDYEVSSIQKYKWFRPRLLASIIMDPYKWLNEKMSKLKFEEWYEVKFNTEDSTGKAFIVSIENVSEHADKKKTLH